MTPSPNGGDPAAGAPLVEPRRAAELLERGEAELVDVRTEHEWQAGRIPGALRVEVNDVPAAARRLGVERPLLVYCRTGSRSQLTAVALRAGGIDAQVLDGGITAWTEQGFPLEPADGYVSESGRAQAELQRRGRGRYSPDWQRQGEPEAMPGE